jgi:general secretion pathway protein F
VIISKYAAPPARRRPRLFRRAQVLNMPQFRYKAKQGPRQVINGVIEADNLDSAVALVIKLGYAPLDVVPAAKEASPAASDRHRPAAVLPRPGGRRVGRNEVAGFTRQMSDLVEAAVPVLRSLQIIARQTASPRFKPVIEEMAGTVRDGGALSEAMEKYLRVFPPLYVNLVRTGEASGQLETVLARLADYLEKEQDNIGKIRNSLMYPLLVLGVGILTVFILLSFVVPRLSIIFEDLGQNLPWPTVALLSVSGVFARFWWLILTGGGILGYYGFRWLMTGPGRYFLDRQLLRLPVLGRFIRDVEVSRFSLTLATLVESGVVITGALNSVWLTVGNVVLREGLREASDSVANGMSVRQALEQSRFFPDMAVNMIAVGEETGKLDRSLYKIAETCGRQADEQMKGMLALLGPVALIFVVIFVGFIVMALLLPVFQMNLLAQ